MNRSRRQAAWTLVIGLGLLTVVFFVARGPARRVFNPSATGENGNERARDARSDDAPRDADPGGTLQGATPARPAHSARASDMAGIRGMAHLSPQLVANRERLRLHVTQVVRQGEEILAWVVRDVIRPDWTYALEGLSPGQYSLRLTLDGQSVSEAKRLALGPGDSVDGVSFTFTRTASVSGRVVADVTGEPVSGASVSVVGEPAEITNPAGEFTLYDLPAGPNTIFVTHASLAPAKLAVDVPAQGAASPVTARPGPGATVLVRTVDAQGAPVPWTLVELSGAEHYLVHETGKTGEWEFGGLSPGVSYQMRVAGRNPGPEVPTVVPTLERRLEFTASVSR